MNDCVSSTEIRMEFTPTGTSIFVPHRTRAVLTRGLCPVVAVGGAPVARVGSSGPNDAEHGKPKVGQALAPLSETCVLRSGCDWFLVEGAAIGLLGSRVRVPDALMDVKNHVLQTDNNWFFVNGEPVVRGRS
jgi:hypothetical protein